MKSNLFVLSIVLSTLLIATILSCSDSGGDGPTDPDDPVETGGSLLWADSTYAVAGNSFRVDIYGVLRSDLLSMEIPLEFTGVGITLDSVSFTSTVLHKTPASSNVSISTGGDEVNITRVFSTLDYVEPDSGVLFTIYGRMAESTGSQVVSVDTTQSVGNYQLIEPDGTIFTPEFGEGKIDIFKRSSVWVDTVDASPGGNIHVDVLGRLEWPVQGIGLPFKIVSSSVEMDSVSFVNSLFSGSPVQSSVDIENSGDDITTVNIIRAYTKSNYIPADTGILASLFFTISEEASSQFVLIDTVTFDPSNFWLVDTLGNGSVPSFGSGGIDVADE